MSQPNGRQEFERAMQRRERQPQLAFEQSPLQRAFDDYQRMENELDATKHKNEDLLVQNMNLVSEVQMLREALERADVDRIRLQAISSTLLGRLLAINDCIGGAVRASIKDGIEAVQAAKPDPDLEGAAEEVAAIIERLPSREGREMAPRTMASPRAPQAAVGGLPEVDWHRMQRG